MESPEIVRRPAGFSVTFVIVDGREQIDVPWPALEPAASLAVTLEHALSAAPAAQRVEVEILPPAAAGEPVAAPLVATVLPSHIRRLIDDGSLGRWGAALATLAQRARDGLPAYVIGLADPQPGPGSEGLAWRGFHIACDDAEMEAWIDALDPAAGVPATLPIVLPADSQSLRSNWPLCNRIVVFGQVGQQVFAFGPYPSDELAAADATARVDEVTRKRASAHEPAPATATWQIHRCTNPLRDALTGEATPVPAARDHDTPRR